MKGTTSYLDAAGFAVKCYAMFSEFQSSAVDIVKTVCADNVDVMEGYLKVMASLSPKDDATQRTPYHYFFMASAYMMAMEVTSMPEFEAFTRFISDGHKLSDCGHGEDCGFSDPDNARRAMAMTIASSLQDKLMQQLVEHIRENHAGAIVSVNPKNTEEFINQISTDIETGFFFEHKLYEAKVALDSDGYIVWKTDEMGMKPDSDEWAEVIDYKEVH
jgi:hypothetical protein